MTNVSPQYYEGFRAAVGGRKNRVDCPPTTGDESPAGIVPPVASAALSEEERVKRELHPLDAFARLSDCAKKNRPPGEDDRFRFQWFGLFYQGPQQDAFVVRVRLPGGRLRAHQLAGLAALTQELAGGSIVCNAQGGLDIPGVAVRDAVEALRRVEEIGLRTMLSGGDCVRAVRGGEYEGLTDGSRPAVIYPLVRALEQALAMDLRLADLPTGCEVILRGVDETIPESDAEVGTMVFETVSVPSDGTTIPEPDGPGFLLTVPGFGSLDLRLTAAQVVPACLELLGRWAERGDRTDRKSAGLAAFCGGVGQLRLREWLTRRMGASLAVAAVERARIFVASPPPVGVPVPAGGLLSGMLERLAALARFHGADEVRLVGPRIFVPGVADHRAVEKALTQT